MHNWHDFMQKRAEKLNCGQLTKFGWCDWSDIAYSDGNHSARKAH